MQTSLLFLKTTGIAVLLFMLASTSVSGATYTATASGAWNAGATWGGTAPSFNLTSDQVIIPLNIAVTLDSDLSINGAASLTVEGTLSGAGDTVSLGTGAITGTGTINVGGVILNTGATLAFLGSVVANTVTNFAASLAVSANFTVNQSLTLAGGTFFQAADTLDMATGSTIVLAGGLLSTSGGFLDLISSYNVTYLQVSALAGFELSGSGLTNLTINVPNDTVTLPGILVFPNINVGGTLSLVAGTLSLNGNNLNISGNIASGGSGSISSGSTSDISIMTATSPSGALQFTGSGDSVKSLTVNIGGANGTLNVSSNLIINDSLNFIKGTLNIGANSLNITANAIITGADSVSYVIASAGGYLKMQAAAGSVTYTIFPIGTTITYAPLEVQLNSGSASGGINVYATDGVDAQGTSGVDLSLSQPVVDVTYYVEPDSINNTDLNLQLKWTAAMEVNGFNPDSAYISHFTAGAWDSTTVSAAIFSGGFYSLTRTNISSFSPFAVFGSNAITTGIAEINNNTNLMIYPNPAYDNLTVNVATGNDKMYMDIIDLSGQIVSTFQLTDNTTNIPVQQLSAGTYFVKLYGNTINEVRKFVKM